MKKSFLLILGILLFNLVHPQEWTIKLEEKRKLNHELTFFDYQDAFYEWCEEKKVQEGFIDNNGVKEKVSGWKQFKRWEWYWETRINAKTGEFPKTTAHLELRKNQEKYPDQNRNFGNWSSLGPFETNEIDGNGDGLGRVNCVAFHSDPNIIYIGSPSGGLWKTTDGGVSWTVLTDENEVLGVSAILAIPGEPYDIIYIGTGDRDSGDNIGIGVLKSLDGGNTWQNTGLSFETTITNSLVHDPVDQNIIYAGTENGIYKSTDAGLNWAQIFSISASFGGFKDIEMHPTNNQILYATISNYSDGFHSYIYKTTNAGLTWTLIQDVVNGKRTEIAVSPDQPDWLFGVVSNNSGGLQAIYKSTDEGNSFTEVYSGSTKNLLGSNCNGTSSGGQGYFDLALAVDPNDANILYVGGINTWVSINSGYSWSIFNSKDNYCPDVPIVHADKHYLGFQQNTSVLFEGNDGGLYKTVNNGISFESLSNGLIISQMYRLGVSQTEPNATICGFQDNGTKLLQSDNTWAKTWGSDGMECIIDYSDYNIKYFSTQNGYLYRRIGQYGGTAIYANGLPVPGPWVTAYIMDPNDHQTLYAGYNNVYKTTDKGDSWTAISNFGSGSINALAIGPSNSNYIYAAKMYANGFFRTSDGGNSWTDILNNLPGLFDFNSITYISVKNDDPNTLWISIGAYNPDGIYKSTDAGDSWVNISAGLPEIPINCVIQNKQNVNAIELYAATDVGVYVKYDENDWLPFSNGMPNVIATELEIIYNNDNPYNSKIRVSTYGRGLWESDLFSSDTPVITQQPSDVTVLEGGSFTLTCSGINVVSYQWYNGTTPISGATSTNYTVSIATLPDAGSYYCELTNEYGSVNSNTVTVTVIPLFLTINPTSVTVSASSGNTGFDITSNESWTIETSDIAVTATPSSGNGDQAVNVNYPAINTMVGETYTATITSGSGIIVDFTINQDGVSAFIALTPDQANVPANAGSLQFSVDCPDDLIWDVTGLAGWLSAAPLSGMGPGTVTLNYEENTGSSSRSDDFLVSGSGESGVFQITQDGVSAFITLTPDQANVPATAGSLQFSVDCPSDLIWDVTGLASWLSASPLSGTGSGTVTLNYEENTDPNSRSDDFSVSGSGATGVFQITQVGAGAPTANFSANPTWGTQTLNSQFTDESTAGTNSITSWNWNFGDGESSTEQHPSHTYSSTGTYTVSLSVSDGQLSDTKTKPDYIQVLDVLTVSAGDDQGLEVGQTTQLNGSFAGGSGDVSILWQEVGNSIAINNPNILHPTVGPFPLVEVYNFTLAVEDLLTGEIQTDEMFVDVITGIDETTKSGIHIYPNPTSGKIWIEAGEAAGRISITNPLGREIANMEINAQKTEINLTAYPADIYIVHIHTKGGLTTCKVVKR
ncbi:MAG: PKD domain-containing protein [Bacteroidales bacterium]|jgi:PKD repeat protein/photosystem II stability/assembly factor-like uncharacterized protein